MAMSCPSMSSYRAPPWTIPQDASTGDTATLQMWQPCQLQCGMTHTRTHAYMRVTDCNLRRKSSSPFLHRRVSTGEFSRTFEFPVECTNTFTIQYIWTLLLFFTKSTFDYQCYSLWTLLEDLSYKKIIIFENSNKIKQRPKFFVCTEIWPTPYSATWYMTLFWKKYAFCSVCIANLMPICAKCWSMA